MCLRRPSCWGPWWGWALQRMPCPSPSWQTYMARWKTQKPGGRAWQKPFCMSRQALGPLATSRAIHHRYCLVATCNTLQAAFGLHSHPGCAGYASAYHILGNVGLAGVLRCITMTYMSGLDVGMFSERCTDLFIVCLHRVRLGKPSLGNCAKRTTCMLGSYSRQTQNLILKTYQMQPPSSMSRSLLSYRSSAQKFTGPCRLHRSRGADKLIGSHRNHWGETF